jgi:uncharacterized protein DUF3540
MRELLADPGVSVGPASVRGVEGNRVLLSLPQGDAEAELALAYPYSPKKGDVVLVLGRDELYIIGVLRAQGASRISLPGDVVLEAGGKLQLKAGVAVEIESLEVRVRADRFETVARAVFERVMDAYRWASGVIQTSAGRTRTLVTGTATLQAERIVATATKDVRIDGERINLG